MPCGQRQRRKNKHEREKKRRKIRQQGPSRSKSRVSSKKRGKKISEETPAFDGIGLEGDEHNYANILSKLSAKAAKSGSDGVYLTDIFEAEAAKDNGSDNENNNAWDSYLDDSDIGAADDGQSHKAMIAKVVSRTVDDEYSLDAVKRGRKQVVVGGNDTTAVPSPLDLVSLSKRPTTRTAAFGSDTDGDWQGSEEPMTVGAVGSSLAAAGTLGIDESTNEDVALGDLLAELSGSIGKVVGEQMKHVDNATEKERFRMHASTLNGLDIARKERALAMDATKKQMSHLRNAVDEKRRQMRDRSSMLPPKQNYVSFVDSMRFTGRLGAELQTLLKMDSDNDDDAVNGKESAEGNALDKVARDELGRGSEGRKKKAALTKAEFLAKRRRMAEMRRNISRKIKEMGRVKKVKSKAFRRRMRARHSKAMPSLDELRETDPALYRREVRSLQKRYAEERVTLKHGNSRKWAQWILQRSKCGKKDLKVNAETRKALMDDLMRGIELKRKIEGHLSDDSDSNSDSDATDGTLLTGRKLKAAGFRDSANGSQAFVSELEDAQKAKAHSQMDAEKRGMYSLKFMREAEKKHVNNLRAIIGQANSARNFGDLDAATRRFDFAERMATTLGGPKKKRSAKDMKASDEKAKESELEESAKRKRLKRRILGGVRDSFEGSTQSVAAVAFGRGNAALSKAQLDAGSHGTAAASKKHTGDDALPQVFEMLPVSGKSAPIEKSDIGDAASSGLFQMDSAAKKQKADDTSVRYEWKPKSELEAAKKKKASVSTLSQQHSADFVIDATPAKSALKGVNVSANLRSTDGSGVNLEEGELKSGWGLTVPRKVVCAQPTDGWAEFKAPVFPQLAKAKTAKKSSKKWRDFKAISLTDASSANVSLDVIKESNPWLKAVASKRPKKRSGKKDARGSGEQVLIDPTKVLIPRKRVSFAIGDAELSGELQSTEQKDEDEMASEFARMKEAEISSSLTDLRPERPAEGWDSWTGPDPRENQRSNGRRMRRQVDEEFLEAVAKFKKVKGELAAKRSDFGKANVILSDKVSKASAKYLILGQMPEWFTPWKYRLVMNERLGRDWNTSAEFFDAIKPELDIPSGHMLAPTRDDTRDDGDRVTPRTNLHKPKARKSRGTVEVPMFDFGSDKPQRKRCTAFDIDEKPTRKRAS